MFCRFVFCLILLWQFLSVLHHPPLCSLSSPRLYVNTDNADEWESLWEKALQSYSVLSVAASLPEEKEEDNSRDDHLSHGEEKEDRLQSSAQRLWKARKTSISVVTASQTQPGDEERLSGDNEVCSSISIAVYKWRQLDCCQFVANQWWSNMGATSTFDWGENQYNSVQYITFYSSPLYCLH